MNRRNLFFLILVILILAGIAVYEYTLPPVLHGSIIDPPKQMPDFTLNGLNGAFQLTQARGKTALVFFGYTNCKDICPATMARLQLAFEKLGSKSDKFKVIFISVDYQRDTPQTVNAFATKFRPEFIGVTGSKAQIDKVTSDYGIYYKFDAPDATGAYEVEHTANVLALDPTGKLIMTWSSDVQPDDLISDLGVLASRY